MTNNTAFTSRLISQFEKIPIMANLNSHLMNHIILCAALIYCFSLRPSHSDDSVSNKNNEGLTRVSFFIFGDSTVDCGNNNYIETVPENRADHKPYGQNGFFEEPTGRFSDGRIIVDFIGTHLPHTHSYMIPRS